MFTSSFLRSDIIARKPDAILETNQWIHESCLYVVKQGKFKEERCGRKAATDSLAVGAKGCRDECVTYKNMRFLLPACAFLCYNSCTSAVVLVLSVYLLSYSVSVCLQSLHTGFCTFHCPSSCFLFHLEALTLVCSPIFSLSFFCVLTLQINLMSVYRK